VESESESARLCFVYEPNLGQIDFKHVNLNFGAPTPQPSLTQESMLRPGHRNITHTPHCTQPLKQQNDNFTTN